MIRLWIVLPEHVVPFVPVSLSFRLMVLVVPTVPSVLYYTVYGYGLLYCTIPYRTGIIHTVDYVCSTLVVGCTDSDRYSFMV